MRSAKRGIFVIISNEHFQMQTRLAQRIGTEQDVVMLRDAFTKLGFDVRIHSDVTAHQMLQVLIQGLQKIHLAYCPVQVPGL